jgi:lipoprotein NlpD
LRTCLLPVLLVVLLLAGCSTPPAPVVDLSGDRETSTMPADGYYRVRRGDTLYTIAFRFGLNHAELARWNGIRSPYTIYPDQRLRLAAPPATAQKPSPTPAKPARPAASPPTSSSSPAVKAAPPPATATRQAPSAGDPASWRWPTEGRVLRGFVAGQANRDGLDIAGREGQNIVASAAGSVVYSGNGLIGFGELIIIKHSDRLLSAYAHNSVRLVQEGEQVRSGQKIAEMGRNDRNEALVHFQIRVNGRPVDPRQYLPSK